jgi:hypothetical protein
MVASVGMKSAKYAISTQTLEPLPETIADLKDMVVELSRAFFATYVSSRKYRLCPFPLDG